MLFFKKKQAVPVDLSWLHTDMHSHLIPGIDDGAPDIQTSLEMVRGFKNLGYKRIITTPHILWELYPNTSEIIVKGLEELKRAAVQEGLDIELRAAAEYFIDDHFSEDLKKKVPLLPISDNLVLVEFSTIMAPMDLQDTLFEMQMQGYQPVIAHPERYSYMSRKRFFFENLKDAGCLFQLNLLSITGFYGNEVQELADYFLKMDYYNLAGTDVHNSNHLALLQKLSSSPLYARLKDSELMNDQLI